MSEDKKKPAQKFRIGTIEATIWKNAGKGNNPFYTVDPSRIYKDGDDWKRSTSFTHDDLLNVAAVMHRAETWIAEQPVKEA